jgi:hypothetical protein
MNLTENQLSSFVRENWQGKPTPLMELNRLRQSLGKSLHTDFLLLPKVSLFFFSTI